VKPSPETFIQVWQPAPSPLKKTFGLFALVLTRSFSSICTPRLHWAMTCQKRCTTVVITTRAIREMMVGIFGSVLWLSKPEGRLLCGSTYIN
jgi:hypothetical protein